MNLDLGHLLGTAISFGLVLFFIYRRFRRNFGKQPLRPKRMTFRIWVLGIVGFLLLPASFSSTVLALSLIVGLGIGVALGIWGAKHTRFEKHDDRLYYIPHTYAGMVVSALFIGRLIYSVVVRSSSFFSVMTINTSMPSTSDFGGFSGIYHNPVTRCVFFILIGYYVYYYSYVLRESKHLKPEDMEDAAEAKKEPPKFSGNT
ncbi:MAG: hypothetical protein ACHQAZ_06300 [Gammaproteobacteria bacterium]|jgi:hypothetical protein|nr:hypothetical protein [Gammaproteobacteria bacterium]